MTFFQFTAMIERISLIRYDRDPMLMTSFDKIQALFKLMCIDDPIKLKEKMKKEQVTNMTTSLHDKYAKLQLGQQSQNNNVSIL